MVNRRWMQCWGGVKTSEWDTRATVSRRDAYRKDHATVSRAIRSASHLPDPDLALLVRRFGRHRIGRHAGSITLNPVLVLVELQLRSGRVRGIVTERDHDRVLVGVELVGHIP